MDKNLTDPVYCAKEMARVARDMRSGYLRNLLLEGAKHLRRYNKRITLKKILAEHGISLGDE